MTFPSPDKSDPARDDPEDQAERGMTHAAQLEKAGGFAVIEADELRKDMEVWMQMYRAAAHQNRMLLDDAMRVRLELQLKSFKIEWEKLEKRLYDIEWEIKRLHRGELPYPARNDPEDGAAAPGRLALDLLSKLLYSQFQEVVFRYPVPLQHLPQNVAQSQQAIAVIQYALQREREDLKQLLNTIGQVAPHLSSS